MASICTADLASSRAAVSAFRDEGRVLCDVDCGFDCDDVVDAAWGIGCEEL